MIPNKLKRKFYKYWPNLRQGARILGLALLIYLLLFRVLPWGFNQTLSLLKRQAFFLSFIRRGQPNLRQSQGRTNLVLLGLGGNNHLGFDLTDSIMFASIDLTSGEAVILSIPRDIWVESMKAKLNTAYHYGEEKKLGGGLILAKAVVSQILGQPIHYGLALDFAGFVKAVDLVDGLEIEVERAFDDYKYPIPGMEDAEPEERRYTHLHFDAGWQHMDGERSLKYVRSRYAEGEEGSDFARSRRQQKVILAFKNKVFSAKTILNPKKIKELIQIFGDSLDTDVQTGEYAEFIKLAFKLDQSKFKTAVLGEDLFYNPPQSQYDGQWVLVPKNERWDQVQEYMKELLGTKD